MPLLGLMWCVLLAVLLGSGSISAQTVCGDGLDIGEQCDDNNTISGDGCSNCLIDEGYKCIVFFNFDIMRNFSMCGPVCGDGRLIDPETCDDNNTMSGDGCSGDCTTLEEGFVCGTMEDTATGFNFSFCNPVCGDGRLIDPEACDDNNTMSGDGCSGDCTTLEEGFVCGTMEDTATGFNFSFCNPVCGDGRLIDPEACDDNNTMSGDGCSGDCTTLEEGFVCGTMEDIATGFNFSFCNPVCGDGMINFPEMCDDNNTRNGDGCTYMCVVEDQFECMQDVNGVSVCEAILLDLNVFDNTTLDYMNEYFDLSTIVYLSDPNLTNMTSFFLSPLGGNWTSIYVFILGADPTIRQEVDVFSREAFEAGRTINDYTGTFSMTELNLADPQIPRNINGVSLARAYRIFGDRNFFLGDGDEELSADEVHGALRSIGYMADDFPGYGPRDVCVTAEDSMYSTTACVSLYFIGRNSNPPTLSYVGGEVANFTEGQTEPVKFIVGTLTVNDTDHPTRYLMQSAEASIFGFSVGQAEVIAVTYRLPDFTYQFNTSTGTLTVTGSGTTDTYTEILSNLTYINNMMEPTGTSRTIQITVFDGSHTSNPLHIPVTIVNVNDAPVVSLNGENPVVMAFSSSYTEGAGVQAVVSDLFVVDTDPMATIQRVVVELTNPVDGERESIAVGDTQGLTLYNTTYSVELSGEASPQTYTAVLRTLTYEHSDAAPGNPTSTIARQIVFYVEDNQGASPPQNSTLTLTIVPVNDGPILFFVANETIRGSPAPILVGDTVQSFNYTEDDPAVNIGQDIYLRDIDGDIMSATVHLSGLLNGNRDHFYFDDALLTMYGVNLTTLPGNGGLDREIVLTGLATPGWYEQILRSLNYRNLHRNDSVTDGQRNVTIFVRDTGILDSGSITAYVNVMDRNDGPIVTLSDEVDSVTVFVENGPSVPIGFFRLIQVMDEEGNNISSMDVNLIATNGNLDPEETLILRTPMLFQFVTDPRTVITETSIHIEINARPELYVQALRSVYYQNSAVEPTLFNETGSNLMRHVLVRITDAVVGSQTTTEFRVTILTETIDDNAPRIIINTSPSCSEDCRDNPNIQKTRSRRDVRTAGRRRKRVAYDLMEEVSMAPCLKAANAYFSTPSCLSNITLLFNTNTSVPIVEVQPDLGFLLHLDPPELNKASHRGYWLDYQTLVIKFERCVPWEGVTTSGREKPMFVMFEAQRGSCDWSSPCTSGVCFSNATGCPVAGFHPITTNHTAHTTSHHTCTDDVSGSHMYYQSGLVTLIVVLLAAMVMGLVRYRAVRNGQSPSQSQLHQVEAGILPHKSRKPVPAITEGSVAVRISPSKESSIQDVLPGKVERVFAMKREEKPQESFLVSKPTPISPGHGSRKKAQTSSPPKKGPPDSSKGSKVILNGDPERERLPSQVAVMAANGEDHVEEVPNASEDEKLLVTPAQESQHAVQDVHHRVCHTHTHNQGQRSRDLVASGNHTPSREQSANSNSYDSLPPDRQYTGSQSSTH